MSILSHDAVCLDSANEKFWFIDHFLGDQLRDIWALGTAGTGTGDVLDGGMGGVYRLEALANGDIAQIDWNFINALPLVAKPIHEARVSLNAITNISSSIYLTENLNNMARFKYSTPAGHNTWHIVTELATVETDVDTGIAPDTNYHIFRIIFHTHGGNHVHFEMDGAEVTGSPISTNVPTGLMFPMFHVSTDAAVTRYTYIDYSCVTENR